MSLVWIIGLVIVLAGGWVVFFGAPYVPSRRRDVRRAFDELYAIGPNDTLVDIGSGDGVVLLEAASRGATAVGYEINPLLVAVAKLRLRHYKKSRVYLRNFWRVELPRTTTVVYLFGESRDIKKMAVWIQNQANMLGRPLYVISYGFTLPDIQLARQSKASFRFE